MLTWLGGTFIHIILTVVTRIASWTLTHVASHVATAGAPMLAGLGQAGVHFVLTVAASASLWAHAVMGAILVHALPTCLAQLLQPHPNLGCRLSAGQASDVTESSTPPRGTKAIGPILDTATPVLAGLMAAPVYQGLALAASEALPAGAVEARVGGAADAPVQTRPGEARVGFVLAVGTRVARAAQAAE